MQWRAQEAIREMLGCFEHIDRADLMQDTPYRVMCAFDEMTGGYREDPGEILAKLFPCEADQIVAVRDIDFVSLCEHHLMPFSGVAHVGYIPNGFVVGLSKIPRVVECFARRLQLQERLTSEIARALEMNLHRPAAVGVVLIASHDCLACRGARKPNARLVTSAMLGEFRSDRAARQEFLSLIGL